MTKVIAITEIHRTVEKGQPGDKQKGIAAVKPRVQIIPPGSIIESTGDELKEFRRLKAVRDPAPNEKIGVTIDPDDSDAQVAAKLAAARAGIAAPGTEQADDGKGSVPQEDKNAAKKAAAAAKAAGKNSDKATPKTEKPAGAASQSSGGDGNDDASSLV